MYLIPFGQNQKSYTIDPKKDKTAQYQFKKWLKEGLEREKYFDRLKSEIECSKESK